MKLLIDTPLKWAVTFDPDISEEEWDDQKGEFEDLLSFLNANCIYNNAYFMESGFSLEIVVQKCVLDEFIINTFFSDILTSFSNKVQIEYGCVGGAGCDFSLRLTQPTYKQVSHSEIVQFLYDNDVKITEQTDCIKELKQLIKDIKRNSYCDGYDEGYKHGSDTRLDNY